MKHQSTFSPPHWLAMSMRFFIGITLPVFLVLTSARLVATEVFLQLEYHRPGFPDDRFGFTREDRLTYGPYAVRYLHNDVGIEYLGDLTIDSEPLYNARELKHMEDVKTVAKMAFRVQLILTLLLVGAVIILIRKPSTRFHLRRGLSEGGTFTIALIVTLVVLVLANWDFFFDGFHAVFFEGDSWQFRTSDTLIRLYPEQFWFDAALVIGGLTIGGALAAMGLAWRWEKRSSPTPPAHTKNGAAESSPIQ